MIGLKNLIKNEQNINNKNIKKAEKFIKEIIEENKSLNELLEIFFNFDSIFFSNNFISFTLYLIKKNNLLEEFKNLSEKYINDFFWNNKIPNILIFINFKNFFGINLLLKNKENLFLEIFCFNILNFPINVFQNLSTILEEFI